MAGYICGDCGGDIEDGEEVIVARKCKVFWDEKTQLWDTVNLDNTIEIFCKDCQ